VNYCAALDAVYEVIELGAHAGTQSLIGFAIKARVIKLWGRSQWWQVGDVDVVDRLTSQLVDWVIACARFRAAA